MELDSKKAQHLVDLVVRASDRISAVTAAEEAFSFLVKQLHALGDSANGYPRNPIDGNVWKEGYELASVCDRFASAVSRWDQRKGEEQATRLAAALALQVVAHYPEEIFPRVLRNAKCCEALGMLREAVDGCRYVARNFGQLGLEELFDPTLTLEASHLTILQCTDEALAGLQRLAPESLTTEESALHERVKSALTEPRSREAADGP